MHATRICKKNILEKAYFYRPLPSFPRGFSQTSPLPHPHSPFRSPPRSFLFGFGGSTHVHYLGSGFGRGGRQAFWLYMIWRIVLFFLWGPSRVAFPMGATRMCMCAMLARSCDRLVDSVFVVTCHLSGSTSKTINATRSVAAAIQNTYTQRKPQ